MNKLITCGLLGLALTQSLVACSDDDDGGENTAGTAGTTAGSGTGGNSTAGAAQGGGNAGKGGTAGTAGMAGTAGKGGAGGKGGTGGTANAGGDGFGGDASVGGEGAIGGDGAGGDGAGGDGAGGDGAGGAPPESPQPATAYWLNRFCDAKAEETLGCDASEPWMTCYAKFYGYVIDGGAATCATDSDENQYENTVAMLAAMEALAAACPKPVVDDWTCNLAGQPEAVVKACRDADAAAISAYAACVGQ